MRGADTRDLFSERNATGFAGDIKELRQQVAAHLRFLRHFTGPAK